MESPKSPGTLVISIDFELYWGMFDKVSLREYGDRILGVRTAIPRMLELFSEYGIHATWATVGMLMARNRDELYTLLPPPHLRPRYEDPSISAYVHIESGAVGENESTDPYHFGPSLVKLIQQTPGQEVGNHTFSHFYCMDGYENDPKIFARDLEAHDVIAKTYGIETESIVFPRNQASEEALQVCAMRGIHAYRGNEDHFLYRPRKDEEQTAFVRALRLIDHYVNISGHHTYPAPTATAHVPLNVPASRFLRPWMSVLGLLEPLRMRRIKRSMTHAAKRGEIFHLWWHPHNFGIDQDRNFKNLTSLLAHYKYLRERYGMQSRSMGEVAREAARVASV